jgi:FlgN protein
MAQAERPAVSSLAREVRLHLDAQIDSARRLLACVLAQGAAIRARDVEGVLARLTDMKTEMARRAGLEHDRAAILLSAGQALGVAPEGVTLEAMTSLMSPADAEEARALSSELRGLLAEIAREHGVNRALMRQELAFLDHLVRLLGREPEAGYSPGGAEHTAPSHRVLDTQA